MNTLQTTIKAVLLFDEDSRAFYDALAEESDMARELMAASALAGATQAWVAARMSV